MTGMSFLKLLLPFVIIVTATVAVVRNAGVDRPYGRKPFLFIFILFSSPLLLLSAMDIAVLMGGTMIFETGNLMKFTAVFLAIFSYSFFARACWRANDAGAGKLLCYLSLVPYLNFFIFLYLCVKGTNTKTSAM